MKNKPWSDHDLNILKKQKAAGQSHAEIASWLGRSVTAINRKADSLLPEEKKSKTASPEEAHWKSRARELERELADAREAKTAQEILCERVLDAAPVSYSPPAFKRPIKTNKHCAPQTAMLLFSDTHIGQVVKPAQTLELGNYNFEIFLRRLKRLERSVFSILENHTTTAIPEIVIPILGDMLDGALIHSAECSQDNTLLDQFYSGGHAIAQFLRNLSAIAPLRIYGCAGNHPRWQNQHRMPTKNRNSNYDFFLYLYVQALTRDIPSITWNLDWQPFSIFQVQGFQFYCGHGENLRGGDKALGIPAHSMGRMVSTTTQLFTRKGIPTPDYYCVGHMHRPISVPHAKGELLVNGAFPGIDGYALNEYFNSSHPSQKFWLMHPRYGRSATYDLRLDLGDDTPHGYELPTTFVCK